MADAVVFLILIVVLLVNPPASWARTSARKCEVFAMKKHTLASYLVNFVAAAAVYILITALMNGGVISRQYQGVLVFACINCILAVSLNLTTGFLGEIALGPCRIHVYRCLYRGPHHQGGSSAGTPGLLLGMLAGGLVAVIFALFIGLPVLRLKGDYLAIVTLGFGEIIRVIVEALPFYRRLPKASPVSPG